MSGTHSLKNIVGQRFGRLVVLHLAPDYDKREGAYWICKCDCEKITKKIKSYALRSGKTTSCGCYQKEVARNLNILPLGENSFRQLLASYQHNASKRSLPFELTEDQFRELTKQKCFYCGVEPKSVARTVNPTGDYIYNGVDRYDNTKGYTVENCVPACGVHNKMKLNMSADEFIAACRSIINHFSVKMLSR